MISIVLASDISMMINGKWKKMKSVSTEHDLRTDPAFPIVPVQGGSCYRSVVFAIFWYSLGPKMACFFHFFVTFSKKTTFRGKSIGF